MPLRNAFNRSASNTLSGIFETAGEIPFDDSDRIVLVSDCHRGDGSWSDDFSKNKNIYVAALTHYYNHNYTYIELGDGDELWKNGSLTDIVRVHGDVFCLLSKFFNEGRLYLLFGNHDNVLKYGRYARRSYHTYLDGYEKKRITLFEDAKHHEGLILRDRYGNRIFLVHGHQVDYMNYRMWRVTRFMVRYLWRPLESFGINDPTSAAKNYDRKESVERKLTEWVTKNNQMMVAGHTHRPMFPKPGEPPYFNDGCCVHPRSITAIELAEGRISLVKWEVKTREDGTLFVGREVLAGPEKLRDYFETK